MNIIIPTSTSTKGLEGSLSDTFAYPQAQALLGQWRDRDTAGSEAIGTDWQRPLP